MTTAIELHPTRCAICGTPDNATELYPANFDIAAFNPALFSARRLPDRVHYRLVRCRACGLVRSDPVADFELVAGLYRQSSFDYGEEVPSLKRTYGRYLARLNRHGARRGALLEIGCGNGFLLEEALRRGYREVRGVEPGTEVVARARPRIRDNIVCDLMRPGLFEPGTFDVVCLFQVFDHIPDPAAMLELCAHVLKPGGLLLLLNHNVESASARLLGERSPIIDLEHTYLYSPRTLAELVRQHGLRVLETGHVLNNYPLQYLTRLLPLPQRVKLALLATLKRSGLGRLRFWVPLGNLFLVARKPVETATLS